MEKTVFNLALSLGFITYSQAQNDTLTTKTKPLTYEVSYVGDNINNLLGGIKTGSCYLGTANIRLNLDIEKAGLWKGGNFYVNAVNTHGTSPSSELLGDMQVASNIDAGNHTYFQEIWLKQAFGKFEFTAGLQDLNVEFANSEHGALFLNSSFGILPTISNNITAPIFPLTALGFTAKWNISEKFSWINALYDGSPTDFANNPYNVKWQFLSGDGLLAITEIQYNVNIKELAGTYKIGVYSYNHIIEKTLNKTIPDSVNHNLLGIYTYVDQKIWQQNQKNIGIFAQLGYSPSPTCTNDFYFGMGINYAGLLSKQGKDVLGLAIAHEKFKNNIESETAIELSYKYQVTKNIFIQPDFQYIINPAGTGETLDNSLAGIFRFGVSF